MYLIGTGGVPSYRGDRNHISEKVLFYIMSAASSVALANQFAHLQEPQSSLEYLKS